MLILSSGQEQSRHVKNERVTGSDRATTCQVKKQTGGRFAASQVVVPYRAASNGRDLLTIMGSHPYFTGVFRAVPGVLVAICYQLTSPGSARSCFVRLLTL
jgi:hypothetical protein